MHRDPAPPIAAAAAPVAASTSVEVRELPRGAEARWDEYVLTSGEATFFHRAGWREVIERAFRHRTRYLLAEQGGRVVGVLPLAQVRTLLFGNALVSLPFCVYGGAAADNDRAREALESHAVSLAESLGVDHLELRHRVRRHPDWPRQDLYFVFRKPILPRVEDNLAAIPRKQRAEVRKGMKAGLASRLDEGVDDFFAAYASSVHRLGTPVFARSYFALLREVFGQDCEVLTVTREGRAVASVLSFTFRDEVLPYYGGGLPEAREVSANDFMYWELMRRACERGLGVFDYGRSKQGTGAFQFKKNWGFEPQPLAYEFRLVRGRAVPQHNPLNPKYRLLIEGWKRLPLPVANWLGPRIVRGLG